MKNPEPPVPASPSSYLAVLIARLDEQIYCREHEIPECESAVIAACDLFLAACRPPLFSTHLERSFRDN